MKKKFLIVVSLIIGIVIIISIIVFSLIDSSVIDRDSLSEGEKYFLFQAEVTCMLADYETGNMWQAMEDLQELADEFGYTEEEMQSFGSIYDEDDESWGSFAGYIEE